MNGDIKIGKLLCEEDIITKRQLNQALQSQIKGDKRSLGEILVDMNFCSLNDITEVVLKHGNGHEEKQEEITEKIEPKKETPEPVKKEPIGHVLLNNTKIMLVHCKMIWMPYMKQLKKWKI